ncbi:MAG: hypothetical protein AAF488_08930 [Planctomycetota bacterium]
MGAQSNQDRHQLYRQDADPVVDWVTLSTRVPVRLLIVAVLCPIVISFGNQTEYVYAWSHVSQFRATGSEALLLWTPWIACVLALTSRFTPPKVAAVLCFSTGLAFFGALTWATHWMLGAFVASLVAVAAGNRVSKLREWHLAPRVVLGFGAFSLLAMGLIDLGRTNVYGAMFSSELWRSSWPLGLVTCGLGAFALFGAIASFRGSRRTVPGVAVSVLSRLLLVGVPLLILVYWLGMSRGGGLGLSGFDSNGLTTATTAFKLFGTLYAVLGITALGLASLLARWTAEFEPVDPSLFDSDDDDDDGGGGDSPQTDPPVVERVEA